MTAAARRPASPYARRLARERGLGLDLIAGTGPGGRIVAADVEAFAHARSARQAVAATGTVSAYTCRIDLEKLQHLLADFGGAEVSLGLDDMLVRAAALALEALPAANRLPESLAAAGPAAIAVAWETGGGVNRRQVVIADAQIGPVSGIRAKLAAAAGDAGEPAALSLRRIAESAIRPTVMPLLPGRAMRLVVAAGDGIAGAEALLCFAADAIDEDDAAAFLARFRTGLEIPLRLLA